MRVDILANDRASFIQPMAEGLVRMLRDVGAHPHLHLDGLSHLMRALSIDFSTPRSLVGSTTKLVGNKREFSSFVETLPHGHFESICVQDYVTFFAEALAEFAAVCAPGA